MNDWIRAVLGGVFGAIEHQTWAYLRGEGDFSVEQSALAITDILIAGIAAPTVAPSPDADVANAVSQLHEVTAESG